jgi:hypothetical protein
VEEVRAVFWGDLDLAANDLSSLMDKVNLTELRRLWI